MSPRLAAAALVVVLPALVATAPPTRGPIAFEDTATGAGVAFTLLNSAEGRKHIIEPMLGGVAILDVDNDGRADIYLVNGARIPSLEKDSPQYWNRLYRQTSDNRFVDVTSEAGVTGVGYGMGVAVADYDNDGFSDMFLPGVNRSVLYRNRRDGTFEDVTRKAGLEGELQRRWAVAGLWLDYDADSHLDLFVVNYLVWRPGADRICPNPAADYRIYCDPKYYEGLPNILFRNNGDGTFSDVSGRTGIAAHVGKGMSAALSDYDGDGRVDVFVANDTLPNFLFRNSGDGRFREVGLQAGVSVNDSGRPVSSMGIDARDYDNDGRDDLIVTALATQTFPLWRNLGRGVFEDATHRTRVAAATMARSGWSVGFYDLDNDGFKDLLAVNGDVQDNTEVYSSRASRQGNAVLRNDRHGAFTDVSGAAGPAFVRAALHRGAAFGDIDNDGRVDIIVSRLNDSAAVFRNVSPAGHWLRMRLVGRRSNRDAIGARVMLETAAGRQWNHVTTAAGYVSASEQTVHFGLGSETAARVVEIQWPSGTRQTLRDVKADQVVTITEP